MIFRKTIFSSVIVGVIVGLLFSLIQTLSINPVIFEAEKYEVDVAHDHGSHSHSFEYTLVEEPWAPKDGAQRTGFSVLANILAGMGYAALLISLMSQLQIQGWATLSAAKGLLWGAAGFITFFVAPGIGLPPEIPGIEAAPVEHRQTWWLLCVCSVSIGLLIVCLSPVKAKAIGLFLMAVPYLVTIPHSDGPAFSHPDPQVLLSLAQLHQKFILFSALGNFILWLSLGFLCAWILNAWILKTVKHV